MGVVGVDIGQQGGHARGHSGAQVLRGQAVKMAARGFVQIYYILLCINSRHGLVYRLNAVAKSKFIYNFFIWLLKINLPAFFSFRIWQADFPTILLTEVVEQVLVKASILDMVWSHLQNIIVIVRDNYFT